MRGLSVIFGTLAVLAGIASAGWAFYKTLILTQFPTASAIQVTQVYSEASFYGIMSIAAFAFAIAVILGGLSEGLTTFYIAFKRAAENTETSYNKASAPAETPEERSAKFKNLGNL